MGSWPTPILYYRDYYWKVKLPVNSYQTLMNAYQPTLSSYLQLCLRWRKSHLLANEQSEAYYPEPPYQFLLESTLYRIFLFWELKYVGGSIISRENTLTFHAFPHYWNIFVRPACDVNNRWRQLSYDWLLCKHPRKTPWQVLLKIKDTGQGWLRG